MTITLYNNTSEKNTIGKNITVVDTLTGTIKEQSSIIHPEITIERTNPTGFNYCYIDEFNRYYYVNDVIVINQNIIRLVLDVDVLESFKNDILSLSCILSGSTTNNDKYLDGSEWVSTVKTTTSIKQFPSGLNNDGEYISITAGG